jgi:predicted RNase H-like HicB family nuclease
MVCLLKALGQGEESGADAWLGGRQEYAIVRKKNQSFTAVIYPDANSDWLVAHNPETGTTTQGKTFEEALANLKEATALYLSEFPQASPGRVILTTFEVSDLEHA